MPRAAEPNRGRGGATPELQDGLRWTDERWPRQAPGQPGVHGPLPARPRGVHLCPAVRPLRGGGWALLSLVRKKKHEREAMLSTRLRSRTSFACECVRCMHAMVVLIGSTYSLNRQGT